MRKVPVYFHFSEIHVQEYKLVDHMLSIYMFKFIRNRQFVANVAFYISIRNICMIEISNFLISTYNYHYGFLKLDVLHLFYF